MLAIELVRLFTCGTTWLRIATVIHVDTPCKLINTEIKLHCCESCNVDKQLQATTTNQTTVYVQLTTASTWRTIQLQKVYTTTRKSEEKNYCTILCYINTHIQKYIYSYFRNSTLTYVDWLDEIILFILKIFQHATLHIAQTMLLQYVRLSFCLSQSHAGIISKWPNILSNFFSPSVSHTI